MESVATDSAPMQKILEHGSYIYERESQKKYFINHKAADDSIHTAAIMITSPEGQWLFIFCFKSHGQREEITLFLNAVQTALNYRLFSDIISGELEQAVEIHKSRRRLAGGQPRICGRSGSGEPRKSTIGSHHFHLRIAAQTGPDLRRPRQRAGTRYQK